MTEHDQPETAPGSAFQRWVDTGKWLTLAANLGVLLGLVVLIFEVRQNAALSRLTVEVNRAETAVTIEMGLTDTDVAEAWMVSVLAPETLTDAQLRMAETQLVMVMQQWDMLLSLETEGLTTLERVERNIRNQAPFIFGSAFGKHWWTLEAVGWQGTPMFEIAGPIIAEVDPNFLKTRYANLRAPFVDGSPASAAGPEVAPETQ